ncbi:MAG: hypothetical protein DI556_06130 [Rhodovulum sulfidophilum]|uniref:Aminoglycoside phosphotransferase domain-containing protein n=1 Tax=Rhodovulum sulfidophilum TaxID=35806 RepID=A0A2W5NIS2_RHOSU|nr:MAG: hypothetical protein DI556_06130 [Rhodovulum sulfidophilum]
MALCDADRAIVARDPALPGLALALDAEALGRELGRGPLVPRYLRYKPGETCTAQFDDGGAGLTLRAVTEARYAIYRERDSWTRPGAPARFLDGFRVVVLPGSADRTIKAARDLLAPERAPATLARLLGAGPDRLVLLKHKPGRRLVARIDRDGRPYALVKAVPRDAFAALRGSAETAAARGAGPILGMDAERGLVAQTWVPGATADPFRATPEDFAAIGRTLATLHLGTVAEAAPAALPGGEALAALAALAPELAPEARALSEGMAFFGPRAPEPIAFRHGDFSADQVILTEDGPAFIDWDRAGPGPARGDLGSFLARLDADVLLNGLAEDRAAALGDAFLAGYAALAGPLDAERVALHRAAALAALAAEPFRERRPDWPRGATALLRRAAALAGPAGALSRALDRDGLEAEISALRGAALRLEPPRVLRDRPGRRALIAYRGADAAGRRFEAYGKLRVKGLDTRTPALHRRLAATGLGDAAAVPEALGTLPGRRLWLQERVEGRLLTDLLAPSADPRFARAAGAALARLHGVPIEGTPPPDWTLADETAALRDALRRAAAARPDLAARLVALGDDLAAAVAALPAVPSKGIHRDFYPDQVILDDTRAWLLDLDLFARGDPAIDIANFIAHLRELGLRTRGDAGALADQEHAFRLGYSEIGPPPPDPERIELLARVSLARHAWISLRVPGRAHVTEQVIARAAMDAPAFGGG